MKKTPKKLDVFSSGASNRARTCDTAVNSRVLYRLSYQGKLCWHLPIFPGSCPPSIFGASELNFRVRDGNGWTLTAISTNFFSCPKALYINSLCCLLHIIHFFKNGDPYGIRTHVAGVRGRSLRPLDQRATYIP